MSRSQSTGSDLGASDGLTFPKNDRIAYSANNSLSLPRATIDGRAAPHAYSLVREYATHARFSGADTMISRSDYKEARSSLKKTKNFPDLTDEQVAVLQKHAKALHTQAKTVVANQKYLDESLRTQINAHKPSVLTRKPSSSDLKRSASPARLLADQGRLYSEDVTGPATELRSAYVKNVQDIRNARDKQFEELHKLGAF